MDRAVLVGIKPVEHRFAHLLAAGVAVGAVELAVLVHVQTGEHFFGASLRFRAGFGTFGASFAGGRGRCGRLGTGRASDRQRGGGHAEGDL